MPAPPIEATGYRLIDDYLSRDDCDQLLAQVNEYRIHNDLPEIHRPMKDRDLRYFVIDGEAIRESLPSIWTLYQGPVRDLMNRLSSMTMEPLTNTRAGVNVNIMPPGRSEYRWHYDRAALTAILYLNEVEGGQTELYPNYRILLNGGRASQAQRMLDRLLQLEIIRRVFGRKTVVEPGPGRLVAMRGNRCWHSVTGVEGSTDRVNIILTYDAPGTTFAAEEGLDSYLYTRDDSDPSDPNYLS